MEERWPDMIHESKWNQPPDLVSSANIHKSPWSRWFSYCILHILHKHRKGESR